MLSPPVDLLNEEEIEPVVAILRAAADLGAANRELRRQFPQWDLPRRLAALRQAQNKIFNDWQKSPSRRKSRASLAHAHAGEPNKTKEEDQP